MVQQYHHICYRDIMETPTVDSPSDMWVAHRMLSSLIYVLLEMPHARPLIVSNVCHSGCKSPIVCCCLLAIKLM